MSGALAEPAVVALSGSVVAARRGRAPEVLLLVVLWAVAAVISGFTIRRHLDPFDEGLLMQAAERIARGQWPYADFGWPYGPGHPLLIALAGQALGPSVLWWRLVRTAADATIALLAFALVRREVSVRWAAAAWLAAAVTMAQPTVANPFPVAFALGLGAVLAAANGRAVLVGALAAAAIFWRPDFGLAGLAAALAALVLARRGGVRPSLRAATTALGLSVAAYAPFLVAAGPHALWEHLAGITLREGAAWRLPFPLLYDGRLRAWPPVDLLHDGKDVIGYELPLVALAGLAAAAAAIAAWAWRGRRARGVGSAPAGRLGAAAALRGGAARGPAGRLGAAAALRGGAARGPAVGLGPAAALRGGVAARAGGGRDALAVPVALAVLGAFGALYLRSRADEFHVQPLAVCASALLAVAAARAGRRRRAVTAVLAALLGFVALAGVANRVSALALPPHLEPLHLPGVPGIEVAPAEAAALPRVVADVQRLVPPGRAVYVAARRSDLVSFTDPLLYFLVRRPSILRDDASLQARPAEQVRIVAALRRTRPVVIRWTDPLSSRREPNERGRSSGVRTLDAYLARAYRLYSRHGAYDVLVPH